MNDLISRQDALAVCLKYNGRGYVWSCIMGDIRKLPSAQPGVPDINIGDMIDRQDAIKAIMDLPNCPNGYSDTYDKARITAVLEDVPSAQPEKRTEKRTETHACDLISRQAAIDALAVFFPQREQGVRHWTNARRSLQTCRRECTGSGRTAIRTARNHTVQGL